MNAGRGGGALTSVREWSKKNMISSPRYVSSMCAPVRSSSPGAAPLFPFIPPEWPQDCHAIETGTLRFFKAEDGIRDYKVTGVQTCALPIWSRIGPVLCDLLETRWAEVRDALL